MGLPNDGLTIRTAADSDIPTLREVFRRAALSNEGDRGLIAEHPEFLEWSGDPVALGHTRVAVDQAGRILGFSSITADDEQPGVVEVEDLFVEPDAMRRGVGRALVDDLMDRARRDGLRTVVVIANRHARDFYERVGFVVDGEVAVTGGTALRMHRDIAR